MTAYSILLPTGELYQLLKGPAMFTKRTDAVKVNRERRKLSGTRGKVVRVRIVVG